MHACWRAFFHDCPHACRRARLAAMVRPESLTRPAGGSPVRVGTGAPGSRPQLGGENRRAERGVKSLLGGSKSAGRSITRNLQPRQSYNEGAEPLMSRRRPRPAGSVPGVTSAGSLRGTGSGTSSGPGQEQERSVSAPAGMAAGGQRAVPGSSEAYQQRCEVVERRAEVGGGHTVALMARTTQPRRSEGPLAGCAFGIGMAAGLPFGATYPLPLGTRPDRPQDAGASVQRRWHGGMRLTDCPGASRVRENRMHGSAGGRWRRAHG
jgi:hypothetical protein